MKFNVPGKLVVPRINRNNEVENTGYMLNELMKAKVNRLRLSVRSYINPTEQNKPLELKPWASENRVTFSIAYYGSAAGFMLRR